MKKTVPQYIIETNELKSKILSSHSRGLSKLDILRKILEISDIISGIYIMVERDIVNFDKKNLPVSLDELNEVYSLVKLAKVIIKEYNVTSHPISLKCISELSELSNHGDFIDMFFLLLDNVKKCSSYDKSINRLDQIYSILDSEKNTSKFIVLNLKGFLLLERNSKSSIREASGIFNKVLDELNMTHPLNEISLIGLNEIE